MRSHYNALGMEEFYKRYGSEYRNPHERALVKCVANALDLIRADLLDARDNLAVLDLACGSGESSFGFVSWISSLKMTAVDSQIDQNGAEERGVLPCIQFTLALCDDEARESAMKSKNIMIYACDPFTQDAFVSRFPKCLRPPYPFSFQDIANGCLLSSEDTEQGFDVCICSFAMHLLEHSNLFSTLYQLSLSCRYLIIVSPHKKPDIKGSGEAGWTKIQEFVHERIHTRVFSSINK